MLRLTRTLSLLVLLFQPQAGITADWQVAAAGAKVVVFVDTANVARVGQRFKAWTLWTHSEKQKISGYSQKEYSSAKSLRYYDCLDRTSAVIQVTFYTDGMGAGEVVDSIVIEPANAHYSEQPPDTIGEMLLDGVCRLARQKLPARAPRE